jgi:hypothetical protein
MKEINLSKGFKTTVSDEDYGRVSNLKWYAHKGTSGHYYAANMSQVVDGARRRVFMHRLINDTPEGLETDHINGDSLDNRRENLRTATKSQNQHNTKLRKDSTSGYKGVSWHKATKKWRARVNKDGHTVFTGYFDDITEAARAYNMAAQKLFGEFAELNKMKGIK